MSHEESMDVFSPTKSDKLHFIDSYTSVIQNNKLFLQAHPNVTSMLGDFISSNQFYRHFIGTLLNATQCNNIKVCRSAQCKKIHQLEQWFFSSLLRATRCDNILYLLHQAWFIGLKNPIENWYLTASVSHCFRLQSESTSTTRITPKYKRLRKKKQDNRGKWWATCVIS